MLTIFMIQSSCLIDLSVNCSRLGVCENTVEDESTAGSCVVYASILEGIWRYNGRMSLVYRAENVIHGDVDLTGCPGGVITRYQWNILKEVLSDGAAVYKLPNLNIKADEKDLVLPRQILQPWKYMTQFQVTVQDNSTDMKVYSVAQTWVEVFAAPFVVTLGSAVVTRYAHDDIWVSAEGSWDPEGLTHPSVWQYTWTCSQNRGGTVEDCAAVETDSRPGVLYLGNSLPANTTFRVMVVASHPGRSEVAASQMITLHDNAACQLSITCARNCDQTRLDPKVPLLLQAVPGTNATAMYQWSVVESPETSTGLPSTIDVTRETLLVEADTFKAGESYIIRLVNRIQDCSTEGAVSTWAFRVRPGLRLGSDSANCGIHRNDSTGCVCCKEIVDELGPVTYKFRIIAPYQKDRGQVQFPPDSDFVMTPLPLTPFETMIPRYCPDVLPQDEVIIRLWVSGTDGRLVAEKDITEALSEEEAAFSDDVIEVISWSEMKDLGTIQNVATFVTLASAKNVTLASKAKAAKTLQATADALKNMTESGSSVSVEEVNILTCTMFTGTTHMLEDSSNVSSNAEDTEKVQEIVGVVYNTMDTIAETYLNTLMAEESQGTTVIFRLPKLHLKVQKGGCEEVQRKILVVQDLVVITPPFRDLSSGCSGKDTVGLVLTEANFNPLQYAGNSQEIRSEVVSMAVRVGGEIKPVDHLPDPIDMIIRRDEQDVASTIFTHVGRIKSDSDVVVAEFRPQKFGTALSIHLDVEQTPEPRDIRLVLLNVSSAPIPENYDNVSFTTVLPVPQNKLFTLPTLHNGPEVNLTASPYSWLILPEEGPIMDYQSVSNTSYYLYILYDTKDAISRAKVTSKFTVSILETACMYFGEESQQWLSDGCKVGPLSNTTHIHCQCDHLTKFSGFVPPNPLRFDKVFSASITENTVGLIAVLTVFGLFLMGCLLGRKADRADLQKIGVTIPTGLRLNSDPENHYVITIYTGYRAGAGTTAQVSAVLFGFLDESEPLPLCDDRRVLFQSGSEDSFLVSTERRLGPLTHVHVWHNNAGFSPGWFLSRVVVKHVHSGHQDYFICNKWLALDEDDGRINRMVFVASPEELSNISNLIMSRMSKDTHDGHLYYSMVGRPARSSFSRVQRLTCCMCTVYCTMVTNIMFYRQGDKYDPPEPIRFMGVEFQLPISLPEIMISVQSAAMILPVTSAIVFLYRNASPRPPKASPAALTEPHVVYHGQRPGTTSVLQPDELSSDEPTRTPSRPVKGAVALPSGLMERRPAVHHLRPTPSRTDPDVGAIEVMMQERPSDSSPTDADIKPKTGFKLPWWASWLAGALAWSVSFVAAFFVVLYSLSFGRVKAEAWLITFVTSFVTDIFLLQPVKLMAAAVGIVLIFRKPDNDDDLPPAATTDDEEYLDVLPQPPPSNKMRTELPGNDVLDEDRARRLRKKKIRSALKEVLLYGMFVCVLMLMSFGERSSHAFNMNKAINGFVMDSSEGTAFCKISDVTSFWQWVDTTLIPATHSPPWYNRQTSKHGLYLPDHMTHLIAPLRFRQVRMRQEQQCTIPDTMANVSARCLDSYSVRNSDTSNYNGSWDVPINPNHTLTDDNSMAQSPWYFTYGNVADGFVYIGKHGTYATGGYVATLNWTFAGSISISTNLQTNNWLDEKTRAVFIETTLYNAHANLFSVVAMVTEFSITGGVSIATEMTTFRLHHEDQVTLLVLRVAMALFMLYYLILAVMNFNARPLEYLTEAGSWLEIFIVFSTAASLGLYFRAQGAIDDITGHGHHMFESYHKAAMWYQMYTYSLSFLICCSLLKFIRLLRFNNHVYSLLNTMNKTAKPLFNFLIIASIIFTAFALAAHLTLGLNLKEYSTLLATYESLFGMMLGSFTFERLQEGSALFGPALFVFFQCTVQFFLLTMFMSIIMDVYAESREVVNPDQLEIMQVLKDEATEAINKLRSSAKTQKDCRPHLEKVPRVTLQDQIQNAIVEMEKQNAMEEVEKHRRPRERRIHFLGNDEVYIRK
ncbi:polycystin-1-like protein 2 [Branchiostoma floridae x Branchiostoma japonicum]